MQILDIRAPDEAVFAALPDAERTERGNATRRSKIAFLLLHKGVQLAELAEFASEDIGLADPRALQVAVAAQQAVHFIGMPEGNLALAEAVVYMATAPKSNALYRAYGKVREDVNKTLNEPVPMQIRNPVTRLMREAGYGEGYEYAHEYPEAVTDLQCLPDSLAGRKYYEPTHRGFEKTIRERMEFLERMRAQIKKSRRGGKKDKHLGGKELS